jgi:hypothetical protein
MLDVSGVAPYDSEVLQRQNIGDRLVGYLTSR